MDLSAISSNPSVRAAMVAAHGAGMPSSAQLEADRNALAQATPGRPGNSAMPSQSDVRKAASQFEAIILRQLLEPSMAPLMSSGEGGSGAGMYSYLLTDSLATNLSQGGGLGWARMLEKQLSPTPAGSDNSTGTASTS